MGARARVEADGATSRVTGAGMAKEMCGAAGGDWRAPALSMTTCLSTLARASRWGICGEVRTVVVRITGASARSCGVRSGSSSKLAGTEASIAAVKAARVAWSVRRLVEIDSRCGRDLAKLSNLVFLARPCATAGGD